MPLTLFKLTYINNEVVSCKQAEKGLVLNGHYHYEHHNGKLIYALIKAENEKKALDISATIKLELTTRTLLTIN